jgi:hypothetical protein
LTRKSLGMFINDGIRAFLRQELTYTHFLFGKPP